MTVLPDRAVLEFLASALGPEVRRGEPLSRYTAMRVGGPADLLLVCETTAEVVRAVRLAQQFGIPRRVLGAGCNVLVADEGVRGLVVVNRAARVVFAGSHVHAEAGALLAALARETVERGLAGLEWATGLPGTVGGAVVGNAGAFGGEIAGVLRRATVLLPDGTVEEQPNEWFAFRYRGSRLKEEAGRYVVLEAVFDLAEGSREALAARAAGIAECRRTRYPSGATMGSTFKNPPGSHAGYLIEQAGLRGHRIGGAQIAESHGNFFLNVGGATAADVLALIEFARTEVRRQFGVNLELEIECLGTADDER